MADGVEQRLGTGGRPYYFNQRTGKTSWERADVADSPQQPYQPVRASW